MDCKYISQDSSLTNLRYVLADLYPLKEDSIAIIHAAGLSPSHITFRDKAINNWSEILDDARKRGKVGNIISAALQDYPNHQLLLSAQGGLLTPIKPIIDNGFSWKSSLPMVEFEKLMGKQSTLLPINWLEKGLLRARSIAKVIRSDRAFGTGFLIKNNLFITNNHVLPYKDDAANANIQFNYQLNISGLCNDPVTFQLDPSDFFQTSSENDWTIVRVKGEANKDWGAIDLEQVDIRINDYANIIQHPGGETKQIALYHNIIAYVDNTRIQYLTDTLPGSSGSAVFDSKWRLIAVHHGGGLLTEPQTEKRVYRNEGIHINCILQAINLN